MIARLASRSRGVITRAELRGAGVTRAEIEHRLATGALIREYPGVFRAGHRSPGPLAGYLAATKACGEGSALSGRAAAWLWGLIRSSPPPAEVSAPSERRIEGLATRRRRLHPGEITIHRGIPTTAAALTLLDLAPLLALGDLARACHEAGVRYRTTPRQVAAVLARRPNAKGAARLRAVMEGEPVSLSKLESKFLELLREAGLPLPITNKVASGRRVDCRWPERRLTVELDSFRFHNSRHAWEQDRRRERDAYARGDSFRRYTWGDVVERPAPMLAELRGVFRR